MEIVSSRYRNAIARFNGHLTRVQLEGLAWLLDREYVLHGGILCDEMGVGKTAQLIAMILGHTEGQTLVICPKAVTVQWVNEVRRFAPGLSVSIYTGTTVPKTDIVISSYGFCRKMRALHDVSWWRVILDEAQEIRNKKSKTHITVSNLKSSIRWAVTGTPIFNKVDDVNSLRSFLRITSNLDICMLRRLLTQNDLPPCSYEVIELEMTPERSEIYSELFNSLLTSDDLLPLITRMRQMMTTGREKLDWISRELDCVQNGDKSIIFTQFIEELDSVKSLLQKKGYNVYQIDGRVTNNQQRNENLRLFRKDEKGIMICNIKAGGVGLNIQEANRVFIMSPTWNSATELQAIGRAHRRGQTKPVIVKKCIYRDVRFNNETFNSIEKFMTKLQEQKNSTANHILQDNLMQVLKYPTKYETNNPDDNFKFVAEFFS
jgi:SNF2 family DNA or RNA helicase